MPPLSPVTTPPAAPPVTPELVAMLDAHKAKLAGVVVLDVTGPMAAAYIDAIQRGDYKSAATLIDDVKKESDEAKAAAAALLELKATTVDADTITSGVDSHEPESL